MYQSRDMIFGGGEAAAMPLGFGRFARVPVPVPARETRVSFVVDLAADPVSRGWRRGAAALALLCGTAGVLALTFELHNGAANDGQSERTAREYRDLGVAPLGAGGRGGGSMAATDRVQALLVAPERALVELDARLSEGDRIEALLMRTGAMPRRPVRACSSCSPVWWPPRRAPGASWPLSCTTPWPSR